MSISKYVPVGLAAATLILSLAACGGSEDFFSGIPTGTAVDAVSADVAGQPTRQVALADAFKDLEEYQPPVDGDQAVFAELKAEMARMLTDLYGGDAEAREQRLKSASALTDRNRGWAVQCASKASGETTLYWRGRHTGDYNMDGLVSSMT
jgi:hypothetical protein